MYQYQDENKGFFDFIKDKEGRYEYRYIDIFIGSINEIYNEIERMRFNSLRDNIFYILKDHKELIYCKNKNYFFNSVDYYISDSERELIKYVDLETMEMYCELVTTFNNNKMLFLRGIKDLSSRLYQNSYEVYEIMKLNEMVGKNFLKK